MVQTLLTASVVSLVKHPILSEGRDPPGHELH